MRAQVGMVAATCVSHLCHMCVLALCTCHMLNPCTHVSWGVQAQAHIACVSWLCTCPSPPHVCSLCVLALHMSLLATHVFLMCPGPAHVSQPSAHICALHVLTLCMSHMYPGPPHMYVPTHPVLHTCSDPMHTCVPCMSQPSTHPYPMCILVACTCVSDLYMCLRSLHVSHACPVLHTCPCLLHMHVPTCSSSLHRCVPACPSSLHMCMLALGTCVPCLSHMCPSSLHTCVPALGTCVFQPSMCVPMCPHPLHMSHMCPSPLHTYPMHVLAFHTCCHIPVLCTHIPCASRLCTHMSLHVPALYTRPRPLHTHVLSVSSPLHVHVPTSQPSAHTSHTSRLCTRVSHVCPAPPHTRVACGTAQPTAAFPPLRPPAAVAMR